MPQPGLERLVRALRESFVAAPLAAGDGLVVAFSGGPDSLALLVGLDRFRRETPIRLLAAHLDHGLDPDSRARAEHARRLAQALEIDFVAERWCAAAAGESPEAAAREARYRFLEGVRGGAGARYVATAHHRDDQAETVALRMLQGSGLEGLAGIRFRLGAIVRPLLGLARTDLAAALLETPWRGVQDPTNRELHRPRNRVRHAVLPRLAPAGCSVDRLAALAEAANAANRAVERRLLPLFDDELEARPSLPLDVLRALPPVLQHRALTALHRLCGHALPPSQAAQDQLLRQIAGGGGVGCDCGPDRRWIECRGRLYLSGTPEPTPPPFTYTFAMPGRIHVSELGIEVEVRPAPVEPWMFRGSSWRAGLRIPAGAQIEVRSRHPGDRLQPLGAPGSRRLKDLLIDRKVARAARARLPLLCVDGQLAWVPGITIDRRFRLDRETEACVAEITPA